MGAHVSTPPPSEYVSSRRIGDATVTVISDGEFPDFPLVWWLRRPDAEVRSAVPELNAEGKLPFTINIAHVRIGEASIVVDAGWDEPPSSASMFGQYRRSPGFAAGLAAIGVQPGQVTHVV